MLFEFLVLSGAQVGSDWTSILKKRQDFRLDYYVVITDMAKMYLNV
jgi:3-methyladenine DNA glycosylase Tag